MDDPLQSTLRDIAAFLNAQSVDFAMIGGLAVSVRGEPRLTTDVDVVIAVDVEGALELLRQLPSSRFDVPFQGVDEVVRKSFILPLRHNETGTIVDLSIGLTGFERQAIARATLANLMGVVVPVLTAEDLLVMKALANRPRDAEDARQLVLRQGDALDWKRVMDVAEQLETDLAEDLVPRLWTLRREASQKQLGDGAREPAD